MSSGEILIYSFTLNEEFIFKAYVTSFSDSFASNWKTENVFGKMDPIATFQNTSRKITMELDVPSGDFFEAKNNFINVSKLISGLYPIYDNTNKKGIATISSPPLFRIKYANLVSNNSDNGGLLCYFDSGFTFNPDFTAGVFNTSTEIYPKLFKASLGFTVLHEQPLGRKANHTSRLPEGKTFPYNLDNLTEDKFSKKTVEADFNTKSGKLADFLNQQEEERKQAAAAQAAAAQAAAVQATATQETPISDKIIEERLRSIAEEELGGGSDKLKITVSNNIAGGGYKGFSIESVKSLTAEDMENNKKAQLALYERLKSGESIKIGVIKNGQLEGGRLLRVAGDGSGKK